jgi:hypothetical protein
MLLQNVFHHGGTEITELFQSKFLCVLSASVVR